MFNFGFIRECIILLLYLISGLFVFVLDTHLKNTHGIITISKVNKIIRVEIEPPPPLIINEGNPIPIL